MLSQKEMSENTKRFDQCGYCGMYFRKKQLTLVHGLLLCQRHKNKGSFYCKKNYIPLVKVARKTSGICFNHISDEDIQKLVETLRRPLKWSEKKILWNEYKRRGIGELEAKERLEALSKGLAKTKAVKKLQNRQIKDKQIDFQNEFNKLIAKKRIFEK